mgnify:CR=1 FL=1
MLLHLNNMTTEELIATAEKHNDDPLIAALVSRLEALHHGAVAHKKQLQNVLDNYDDCTTSGSNY